jgi:hypothetical protein
MTQPIIDLWYEIVVYISVALLAAGVVITAAYFIKLYGRNNASDKYEFVSKNQAKYFLYSAFAWIAALAFYANILLQPLLETSGGFEVTVIFVVTALVGFGMGYIAYIYYNLYYSSVVEKRLIDIRFKPRISKAGQKMRLLSEDEEDIHLTDEMIKDEEDLKFEYDVWLDESSGEKYFEKYNIHFHALVCDNCEFRTLTSRGEKIVEHPTHETEGIMIAHYKCANCDYAKEVETRIPTLVSEAELH